MNKYIMVTVLLLGLSGCYAAPPETTYETILAKVPPCPEAGLGEFTFRAVGDTERAWAEAAFNVRNWTYVDITEREDFWDGQVFDFDAVCDLRKVE